MIDKIPLLSSLAEHLSGALEDLEEQLNGKLELADEKKTITEFFEEVRLSVKGIAEAMIKTEQDEIAFQKSLKNVIPLKRK